MLIQTTVERPGEASSARDEEPRNEQTIRATIKRACVSIYVLLNDDEIELPG
jgi:hypothetical protein